MEPAFQWVEQACPICDAPPTRYLGRRGGAAHRTGAGVECRIWQCRTCGLIFPNPMPLPQGGARVLYDLDSDAFFANHEMAYRDARATELVQEAARLCGRKGSLLDIGAGRGEVPRAASNDGWRAVGLEPSPSFAAVARAHAPNAEILEMSLGDANLPARSFDVVILQAVLEHLHDPATVMSGISRVLAPGGVFYADVPNELSLYSHAGNLYQRLRGRDWVVNLSPTFSPFHVFGYSVRSLRALFRKYHLEPIRFIVRGGSTSLPPGAGLTSRLEHAAAAMVTNVANTIGMGTYIASWSRAGNPTLGAH